MQEPVAGGRDTPKITRLYISVPDENQEVIDDDALPVEEGVSEEEDGSAEHLKHKKKCSSHVARIQRLEAQLQQVQGRLVLARQQAQEQKRTIDDLADNLESERHRLSALQSTLLAKDKQLKDELRMNSRLDHERREFQSKERRLRNQIDDCRRLISFLKTSVELEIKDDELKRDLLQLADTGTEVPNYFHRMLEERNRRAINLQREKDRYVVLLENAHQKETELKQKLKRALDELQHHRQGLNEIQRLDKPDERRFNTMPMEISSSPKFRKGSSHSASRFRKPVKSIGKELYDPEEEFWASEFPVTEGRGAGGSKGLRSSGPKAPNNRQAHSKQGWNLSKHRGTRDSNTSNHSGPIEDSNNWNDARRFERAESPELIIVDDVAEAEGINVEYLSTESSRGSKKTTKRSSPEYIRAVEIFDPAAVGATSVSPNMEDKEVVLCTDAEYNSDVGARRKVEQLSADDCLLRERNPIGSVYRDTHVDSIHEQQKHQQQPTTDHSTGPSVSSSSRRASHGSLLEKDEQRTKTMGAFINAGPSAIAQKAAPGPSFIKRPDLATTGLNDTASFIHHGPDGRGGVITAYRSQGSTVHGQPRRTSAPRPFVALNSESKARMKRSASPLRSISGKVDPLSKKKLNRKTTSNGLQIYHFFDHEKP